MIFEICIDSLDGLQAAVDTDADRVELCPALVEGGITPSIGLIEEAVARSGPVRVHVLIRPRGGDFCYDEPERAVMRADVAAAVAAGAHGVVVGALTADREVDTDCLRELTGAADGRSVTFHRAFDHARDPFAALDALLAAGVERVLTSGQQPTPAQGADLLRDLHRYAAGRIGILAGGGIDPDNARTVAASGVGEMHFSARVPAGESQGGPVGSVTRMRTSPDRIRAVMAAARSGS